MMLLTGTTDIVRVITGSAADVEVHASWIDNAAGTITPGRTNTSAITTAATTTVVASPAASTQRNVKHLNMYNNHATVSTVFTVEHFDGTTAEVLWKGTLLAAESLVFDASGRWTQYDANGLVKAGAYPVATQAEMEAAASLVTFVTPGRQQYHPGECKFWCQVTGAATPVITTSYNTTSITDTAAGRLTVTIGTDFSSANWVCQVSVFTSAVTGDEGIPNIAAKAAGTCEVNNRVITPAWADATVGYDVAGWGDQ